MFQHVSKPLVIIKGAGDLGSGVAYRLYKCGFNIVMTEIEYPLVVRRTVSFAEAVHDGKATVEGITACLSLNTSQMSFIFEEGMIPVLIDMEGVSVKVLQADVVVDARVAKRNLGTTRFEAPLVIGLGPGFEAGVDVHAVIETCRGHSLGRVIYEGQAIPNTGEPGEVGGASIGRLLRAPADGVVESEKSIGDVVEKGEVVAHVDAEPVKALISGRLRGMIRNKTKVVQGTKIGDIDPRLDVDWKTISDKALAVGGGVLEAVFHYYDKNNSLTFK